MVNDPILMDGIIRPFCIDCVV